MAMNEEELARWFDSRRGDTSNWSATPVKATVRRGGTVVFSLRFSPEELELLRQRAEQAGTTISELIRSAAFERQGEATRIDWPTLEKCFVPPFPPALVLQTSSQSRADAEVLTIFVGELSEEKKETWVYGERGRLPSVARSG